MTIPLPRTRIRVIGLIAIGIAGIGFAASSLKKPALAPVAQKAPSAIPVRVRTAQESHASTESVLYPGTIASENEAVIIAKTNGTASNLRVNVGDRVEVGQELVKIDDVTSSGASSVSSFNAGQVKQAEAAVQQALVSLQLARSSFATVLQTTNHDLSQAQITANQSGTAQQNVQTTTNESLKSAELALQTAKLATESARLAYENRQKLSGQSAKDTDTNATIAATSAVDTSAAIIAGINVVTGLETDDGGILSYRAQLGALDAQSSQAARRAYVQATTALQTYRTATYPDLVSQLDAAVALVNKTKELTSATRHMLDATIPSSGLPQATLAQIQTQVIGYQSQMNATLSQLNLAKQGLNNVGLTNDTALDGLRSAYEIAKQQEQSAAQSVANLKAGNTSQTDQAGYTVQSAKNQLTATQSRIGGQVSAARSQVDLAEIQYNNAVIALQNLSDAHRAISPIAGVVTMKNVSNGDTVSQGQILATIGTPDRLKVSFFIDQEALAMITVGQQVTLISSDTIEATGTILSVAPQADAISHRYRVEVHPNTSNATSFPLGSIVDIQVPLTKTAAAGNSLVPLSAVDVTQNGTFLTIVKEGKAEVIPVTIVRVLGEIAEIKAELAPETKIVIDGNRLTTRGATVTIIE